MALEVRKLCLNFTSDDRGVTLVEYGVAISLVVIVGALALPDLVTAIGSAMGAVGASLPN